MQNFIKTIINGVQSWTRKEIKKEIDNIPIVNSDWNENNTDSSSYIKNRPFYDDSDRIIVYEAKNITWDRRYLSNGGMTAIYEYDLPYIDLIPNKEYGIFIDGKEYIGVSEDQLDDGIWIDMFTEAGSRFSILNYRLIRYIDYGNTGIPDVNFIIFEKTSKTKSINIKFLPQTLLKRIQIIGSQLEDKMEYTSPVGEGTFSMNRKANSAKGSFSMALGNDTTASGFASHAEGHCTNATSDTTVAVTTTNNTTAGYAAHAEGYGTVACGAVSHAEGNGTKASGRRAHAEGYRTTADGEASHAEGSTTYAYGSASHAEGGDTVADGSCSHAEGSYTKTSAPFSHAEGNHTVAASENQHVQGKFNIKDDTRAYAHIVGNGIEAKRSNAHTLDWNGVGWFQGGLQVGGNAQDDEAKNVLLEGDAVPVPVSASIGQTIAVKAVDENGKPTEWECVNLPNSGGNVDLTGVVRSVNGIAPDEDGNVEIMVSGGTAAAIDYDQNVHSVNHRGYSASAPENTIPAYILSKQMGFTYAEADVSFTSDGVAVLLHDATIDRTSNGSGSISAMTYAEASKYDYGSWKNTKYTGTRIPTFEEFIVLCKRIGLHPYIELKQNGSYTEAQIQALVEMVKNCGMEGKVTWISFAPSYLGYVKAADPSARLGYLVSSVTSAVITTAQGLQTDTNEVFIDSSDYDADAVSLCQAAGLPLEIWTINSSSTIQNMNAYITGVTSDNLIAGKILHDAGMVYEYGIGGETEPDEPVVPDEPEKTLTSISATYSGGNVAVGTNVNALTGIVVTARYSDGSSETVTGYTLSGTIAEGGNIITVTYEGKTATFVVTGVAESGDDNVGDDTRTLLYNWDFTNSLVDTVNGTQATLIGNATQNANGLTITDATSGANFGAIAKKGMTFEVDIAEGSTITNLTSNGRLLCFNKSDGNSNGTGVVWRGSESAWNTYVNTWGTPYSDNPTFFSGKTMTVVINEDGTVEVYSGSEVQAFVGTVNFDSNGYVSLGSVGTAAAGMVVTAMRIYDRAHSIPQDTTGAWVDDTIVLDASLFGDYRLDKKYNSDYDIYESSNPSNGTRLSYSGKIVTIHPGFEYTVTIRSTNGQITNVGAWQVQSYKRLKGKATSVITYDPGWQSSGYTFTQYAEDYDVMWITLRGETVIPDGELISVTITRRKV